MSIDKITNLSIWIKERNDALIKLKPQARNYKRTRGKPRSPEEKKALVLAAGRAWNDWLDSGKLKKTDKGYELCKV